jgi:hypothetical protein
VTQTKVECVKRLQCVGLIWYARAFVYIFHSTAVAIVSWVVIDGNRRPEVERGCGIGFCPSTWFDCDTTCNDRSNNFHSFIVLSLQSSRGSVIEV